MRFVNQALLTVLVLTISFVAQAARINLEEVLFGIEYTFQDQTMVDEPGRSTMTTPHKEAKAQAIVYRLAENVGLPPSTVVSKTTWKPGHYINVPNDGKWVVNAEPVTIEVNTTPRHYAQIVSTAEPIFEATKANGLVPYVNPAAERSGMGHVHVGARKMGENPFFTNPLLLRNVMVYLHKHPALLFGFSEAYDNGLNSNIETYHVEERQKEFEKAIATFDRWYDLSSPAQRKNGALNKLLDLYRIHGKNSHFFEHYRYINLEHIAQGNFTADNEGKLTVEFRNFRPPKDPETAKAFATLLVAIMEKQSAPEYKEPFAWITPEAYRRFNTGTKVASDWIEVRKVLSLNDKHLNAAVREYVTAIQKQKTHLTSLPNSELFSAYSEKENKGTYFELRLPVSAYAEVPHIEANGASLEFEKVAIRGAKFWVASVDTKKLNIAPIELLNNRASVEIVTKAGLCRAAF